MTTFGPSPQECIEYVIAAQGNTKLAAARLNKIYRDASPDSQEITEARLLTIITQDPNSLNTLTTQIRLLTVMQAADAFRLTHQAFLASLAELSASSIARTYLSLLNTMTTLSSLTSPTVDPYDAVMRSLPTEVATAVQKLLSDNTTAPNNSAASPPTPNNNHDITLPTIITQAPPKAPVMAPQSDDASDTSK